MFLFHLDDITDSELDEFHFFFSFIMKAFFSIDGKFLVFSGKCEVISGKWRWRAFGAQYIRLVPFRNHILPDHPDHPDGPGHPD